MSNYRRLISYIYAYEGGIKGKNIGFAKIETKGVQCKITVSVKRIYVGGNDIGVYLLASEHEIFLGSIFIRGGSGEFRTLISSDDIENSGINMDQCFGLTVHDIQSTWRSYTTIWEDAVTHAAEVELEKAANEVKEEERPAISEAQIKKAVQEIEEEFPLEAEAIGGREPEDQELTLTENDTAKEDNLIEETKQEEDAQQQELTQTEVAEAEIPEVEISEAEVSEAEVSEAEISEAEISEVEISKAEVSEAEISEAEVPEVGISEAEISETEISEAEVSEAEIQDFQPENSSEIKAQDPELKTEEITDLEPADLELEVKEHQEASPEEENSNMTDPAMQEWKNDGQEEKTVPVMNKMTEGNFRNRGQGNRPNVVSGQRDALIRSMRNNHENQPSLGNREELDRLRQSEVLEEISHNQIWEKLKKEHTRILAFDYENGCEILTIKPQDIGLLPREAWVYGNNSFLLHGYYNYRYLILAKLLEPNSTPRYLLGIPGHYFSNERYMASMFGFPNFVLSKEQPKEDGRFGFWYTDVKLGG